MDITLPFLHHLFQIGSINIAKLLSCCTKRDNETEINVSQIKFILSKFNINFPLY